MRSALKEIPNMSKGHDACHDDTARRGGSTTFFLKRWSGLFGLGLGLVVFVAYAVTLNHRVESVVNSPPPSAESLPYRVHREYCAGHLYCNLYNKKMSDKKVRLRFAGEQEILQS